MKGDIKSGRPITFNICFVARRERLQHHILSNVISHLIFELVGQAPIEPMHVGQVNFNSRVFLHLGSEDFVQIVKLLHPDLRCKETLKRIKHQVWITMLVICSKMRFHGGGHQSLNFHYCRMAYSCHHISDGKN
jgi:hypothetical protein